MAQGFGAIGGTVADPSGAVLPGVNVTLSSAARTSGSNQTAITDERGAYQLHCPTPGCRATPRDWFYHGTARLFPIKVTKSRAPVIGFGREVRA